MLPNPLLLPLRFIPDAVHAEVLARVFNHLLRGQSIVARLSEINGKSIAIRIKETANEIHFRVEHGRLRPEAGGRGDVCIVGTLDDYWRLATRHEDPDTLFFNRRLCIEGDTDTGVHVKNLLDALDYDWEAHFRDVFGPLPATLLMKFLRRILSSLR